MIENPENCPVPLNQRPIKEFEELCKSWFFSLPNKDLKIFNLSILIVWLTFFPIFLTIFLGSVQLKQNPFQLLFIVSISTSFAPLILLLRQWLGWNYIQHRLLSDIIEYEETGWYDGQRWLKPISWKQKDLLVSQLEVVPIIARVNNALMILLTVIGLETFLYKYLQIKPI